MSKKFAVFMLFIATLCWGLSFPFMKALNIEEQLLSPLTMSFHRSFATMALRFGVASLILIILCNKSLLSLTKRETVHGCMIGLFIGTGGIVQLDGLNFTSASTSAFLTAFYAIIVPVLESIIHRKLPHRTIIIAVLMVLSGMAILTGNGLSLANFGRGDWETLFAAFCFSFQILWMERIDPKRDKTLHITLIMCLTVFVMAFLPAVILLKGPSAIFAMHSSINAWTLILILAGISTVVAFIIMNRYQPFVSATTAGIIYCAEPVFAAASALFLPALLVRSPSLYPNEVLNANIIIGGILITIANVLVNFKTKSSAPNELLASQEA